MVTLAADGNCCKLLMSDPEALFLGGHPALDFLNTKYGSGEQAKELIGDGASFLRWLVRAGLLDPHAIAPMKRRLSERSLDLAAAEARKLRDWAVQWITRWSDRPKGDYAAELRRLNGLLEHSHSYREAIATTHGLRVVAREHLLTADELVAAVALPLAVLVAEEDPQLIKRCAGPSCTLWFLDKTKAHRRLFCSATGCGNRAKVAAFRERQREH
jgi:predicted RNA-binding Zn ribbon-like protein